MSRDIVGSLEQLGLASNIGMGMSLHNDDEGTSPPVAPAKIDLAFRTNDLARCFPPSTRVLFDSDGAKHVADIVVDEHVVVIEEFAHSLRIFSEAADAKIATFQMLLDHDVHFDAIAGPIQGVVRNRLHRLREGSAKDVKVLVVLTLFAGLSVSDSDVDQYELLRPEASLVGRYVADLMPPGMRFTVVHTAIRNVYEFALELQRQVLRKATRSA